MIRVLLADDHEIVRAGLRALLAGQSDMEVVGEAPNGTATLEAIRTLAPDVAIVDLAMPQLSGLDVARRLAGDSQKTAVVILTRHDDRAYVDAVFATGVLGYVLKQSPSTDLLDAVRSVAAGRRYADHSLDERDHSSRAVPRRPTPTPRERDVLRLTAKGHSNKEIAAALSISVKTVEVHKANGMRKLHLTGRADVVRYAAASGWLTEL